MLKTSKSLLVILLLTISGLCFAITSPPTVAKNGMVVTAQPLATQVGLNILKQGGNAIDAAVAVGYALAVTYPCCGNLGGGGFMLIHLADGNNIFLNFREKAPLKISNKLYFTPAGKPEKKLLRQGYLAVGVPGSVMGLNTALKKYGTMSLKQVMAPAIKFARDGFKVNAVGAKILDYGTKYFKQQKNVSKIFLYKGKPYQAGQLLKQEDLANTLELIANQGTNAFYQGKIADEIVKASKLYGGILTKQDFEDYTVQWMQPITCNYRGYTIISAPPPSSGGVTLCEMLNVLKAYPLSFMGFHSSQSVHYTVEAMRYAYADRNEFLGDPDFVHNPIQRLLSKQHAAWIRSQIQAYHAGDSAKIGLKLGQSHERMQTTHYSIVDKYGNAVAVTFTINGYFGAKVIAGNTGFFLNNELDDFTLQPGIPNVFQLIQGKVNAMAPGKRPLSSMTPTIVLKDNKIYMVLGAAGGSTIITQVLLTIQNVIDYEMGIQQAVDASRFHMQWLPDVIYYEPFTFSQDTMKALELMGYKLKPGSPYGTAYWGQTQAILHDLNTGLWYGASDNRGKTARGMGF